MGTLNSGAEVTSLTQLYKDGNVDTIKVTLEIPDGASAAPNRRRPSRAYPCDRGTASIRIWMFPPNDLWCWPVPDRPHCAPSR